jgi:hypothetical protein
MKSRNNVKEIREAPPDHLSYLVSSPERSASIHSFAQLRPQSSAVSSFKELAVYRYRCAFIDGVLKAWELNFLDKDIGVEKVVPWIPLGCRGGDVFFVCNVARQRSSAFRCVAFKPALSQLPVSITRRRKHATSSGSPELRLGHLFWQ